MNCRQRVRAAIDFRHPDRLPYEISVGLSQFTEAHTAEDMAYLEGALGELGVPIVESIGPDGSVLRRAGLSESVAISPTPATFPRAFRPLATDEWVDEWGVIWTSPMFPRVHGHPLESGWEGADTYTFPDPRAPERYDNARQVIAERPGLYRLGRVWFTLFERLWFLRGFNEMLMDPYLYPDEFARLRDRIVAFNLASIEEQLRAGVDGIFFSDDWGSQNGLLMRADDWRKWYKPAYKAMFDAVYAGGAQVWMHLCGNVMEIVGDLVEVGLNVLNPVQPQAMSVDELARRFGGKLCFYGGVDVQGTLPYGTEQDVENEVRHLIDIFGYYGGGYIGTTSHTILPDTPVRNVVALFKAFQKYA